MSGSRSTGPATPSGNGSAARLSPRHRFARATSNGRRRKRASSPSRALSMPSRLRARNLRRPGPARHGPAGAWSASGAAASAPRPPA
ncbi:MAG: hypothetical protein MZV64_49935 [Ignavibacteriales bacterium]|nr:hypothetical protein [Ignavibacteriales bacterium]